MISQKLQEFQNEMDKMFQRKTVTSYAITRIGTLNAYSLEVGVQGLPFKVVGYGKDIEEAENAVLGTMFDLLNKASKCDLFMTKEKSEYQEVELTREEIQMIYDLYEEQPDELIDMYMKETKGFVTKLENGQVEFVIENESYNLHARATLRSERFARKYALYTARHIVDPETEYTNREALWSSKNS